MEIPVYAVTGFLDAGKTTFLNNLLNRNDWREIKILLIQFESGEARFYNRNHNCENIVFNKKTLEQKTEEIIGQIIGRVESFDPDEIWVEWNGVVPFSLLQSLLLHPLLRGVCKLEKVIHIADAENIVNLLGRTGAALPEQIANSDFAALRNVRSSDSYKRIKRLLDGINPGIKICDFKAYSDLEKQLFVKKVTPVNIFFFLTIVIVSLFFIIKPLAEQYRLPIPFNTVINIFLGILLQAIPFLLIGVLLSSAIQIFIPQRAIERWFPKSIGIGMFAAIIAGFCLPVCDCASIPIFRSLVKKGIPLPVAITFMTATPVINPVVILSTYYAFGGNIFVVVGRVSIGIIAAILMGFIFALFPPKERVLSGGALDRLMCSCGCYEDAESVTTFSGKAGLFVRHSKAEFFSVGKYLVIGTFIAAVFQVVGNGIFSAAKGGWGLAASILFMMAMAFTLSLCSSSDAMIARSFAARFPMGAIMGFLLFGPIMDIKNVMMLSSRFTKKFIGRLLVTAFIVCFAVVFVLSVLGGM